MENKNLDMTSGNLFYKLFKFSLPIIISGILQLLYSAADLAVCGRFGSKHSVAAISNTNSITALLVEIFMGLSVGANVLIARYYALKNQDKSQDVLHTSLTLSVITGLIVGLFGFIISYPILRMIKTPDEVIDLSAKYLKIYFLGLPFLMIYNFGAACLRACGDTKRPFVILFISGLINVAFNFIFVKGFNMDVKGVAIATDISQGISALLIVILLLKGNGFIKLHFNKLKINLKTMISIIEIGVPAGLQAALFSIANVLIQSNINTLGTTTMDADGASWSVEAFIYQLIYGVSQATVVFVSANYAIGNYKNIRKVVNFSLILAILYTAVGSALVSLYAKPIASIYLKDSVAVSICAKRLYVLCAGYVFCATLDVYSAGLRGIGHSALPTIITVVGTCLYRILWMYTIFKIDRFHTNFVISLAYPISWLLTTTGQFIFFELLFSKYKKNMIAKKVT